MKSLYDLKVKIIRIRYRQEISSSDNEGEMYYAEIILKAYVLKSNISN